MDPFPFPMPFSGLNSQSCGGSVGDGSDVVVGATVVGGELDCDTDGAKEGSSVGICDDEGVKEGMSLIRGCDVSSVVGDLDGISLTVLTGCDISNGTPVGERVATVNAVGETVSMGNAVGETVSIGCVVGAAVATGGAVVGAAVSTGGAAGDAVSFCTGVGAIVSFGGSVSFKPIASGQSSTGGGDRDDCFSK